MTRRAATELGTGLALMAGILAVAYWGGSRGLSGGDGQAFAVTRPEAVSPAPELDANDLVGRPVRLRDFRGCVVLLNLWATWCVPCRQEMPALDALSRDLAPRGLVVLAVNHMESSEVAGSFVREYGLTLPVLLDRDGGVAVRYRSSGLPSTYVIDRRGALVGLAIGLRDWGAPAARQYLERVLAAPA